MSLLELLLPGPQAVLYLGNIALAACWSCTAALLAAIVCRGRPAPTRHGLLLLGLVMMLTSPAWVWLIGRAEIGQLQVVLDERREPLDAPDAASDAPLPMVNTRRAPRVTATELDTERQPSAEERPAPFTDRTTIVRDTPAQLSPNTRTGREPAVERSKNSGEPALAATVPRWLLIARGLALLWVLGTTFSILWFVRGLARLAAFCRHLEPHPADEVQQSVELAAVETGLTRAPRLFVSMRAAVPITLGLFRPAIVLPGGFADGLSPAQVHAVLLHEVAHIIRRDVWIGLAQRIAAVMYWWCPLVHRLNRHMTDLREEICDGYVLRKTAGASLAEALVTLAGLAVKPPSLPAAVSVLESRAARKGSHPLENRVHRLLSTEANPMIRMSRAGMALVVFAGLCMTILIALSQLRAADDDSPVAEKSANEGIPITADGTNAPEKAPAAPIAPLGADDADQAKAIAEIESLGGRVARDEDLPGRPVFEVTLLYQAEFTYAQLERLRVFDHLRVLILGQSSAAESELTRMPDLPRLQELWLYPMKPNSDLLESLQQLPKLETLHLLSPQLSDANLRAIGSLKRLKELRLTRTALPSASLAHLAGLTQLEHLALADTRVRDADLKHLRQMSQLERLSFDGTFTTTAGLQHLAKLPKLSELDVDLRQIGDAEIVHVNQFAALTALDLSESQITDAGLGQLTILPQLTQLSLPDRVTDAGLTHLRRATQLEVLRLGSGVTDAGLASLSGLARLEQLTLGRNITDAGLEHLGRLTRLKLLKLSSCNVTEDGLRHLRGLTQLAHLYLPYKMPLSDTGLAHLGCLTQLESLNLRGSSVTDEGLRHLRGMSQLLNLELSDTEITDAGLVHLRGFTKLHQLDLANTKVTGTGFEHLPRNGSLVGLSLSGSSITDAGLAYLQDLDLRSLYLGNTGLTDVGMEHLGRLKSVILLDLQGCEKITDAGLAHLQGHPSLGSLNLTQTQVTDAGLAHLHDLKLVYLDLRATQVTDTGLAHLSGLTTLTHLDLRGTEVSDRGLEHLAGLTSLVYLYLGRNVMGNGLVHFRGLPRISSICFERGDVDVAAVWQFKKERPDIQIQPDNRAWGWDNPARIGPPDLTLATQRIIARLENDTRWDFVEIPLTDVLEFIQAQHDMTIQLDESTLEAAGTATDLPMTEAVQGITLHSGLRLLLSQSKLSYVVRDDALVITTKDEAQRLMQQGVINADEVEHEFAKQRNTSREQRAAKTVHALMQDTRCQITDTPLTKAVTQLTAQTDIPVEFDRARLARAGISPDVRCTLNVQDLPLGTVLRKLLSSAGLTYVVDCERLVIKPPRYPG